MTTPARTTCAACGGPMTAHDRTCPYNIDEENADLRRQLRAAEARADFAEAMLAEKGIQP